MASVVDLHTHTVCSDGMLTPEALVARARENGVRVLGITDHDTFEGLADAVSAGASLGVDIVSGVELSIRFNGRELHMLGYFFDPKNADLLEFVGYYSTSRERRALKILEKLNGLGISLSPERVRERVGGNVIGRPHIAQAMVADGHVESYEEAFIRFLRNGGPADVSKELPRLSEALKALHGAGGIGVLAHPGHWVTDRDVHRMVDYGLDGIEIYHPSHDEMLSEYYTKLAQSKGLVMTGGSDYHGMRAGDEENLGRIGLSVDQFESLREAVVC